jgi:LemA protein
MLLQEQYPNLKAAPLFSDLNVQLEWTENRIATERWRYNEEIKIYNSTLRQFPNNFISSMFWISTKPVFESNNWSEIVPDVKELFQ